MMRLVIDPESSNECDHCGKSIDVGIPYYAEEDDVDIICGVCMSEMIKLSNEILDEIIAEENHK